MADTNNADEIKFATPFGTIAAHGINIVLLLSVVILSWLTYTEHAQRSHEHDDILKAIAVHETVVVNAINYGACLARLNLFIVTAKDPTKVTLNNLPSDLWNCLPRWLSEESQAQRKQQEAIR